MTPPHQHQHQSHSKRILIVCDEGLNRSQTIKGQIQYWGHDVLTVGRNRNTKHTIESLIHWSELVIAVDEDIVDWLTTETEALNLIDGPTCLQLWNIGPDKYPRPYNKELLDIVKTHIKQHEAELKPPKGA